MERYINRSERYKLAREIAEEGIILLKNEGGILPIDASRRLAVFGRGQIDVIACGTGSAYCRSEYCIDLLTGLEEEKIPFDSELAAAYRQFSAENPIAAFGVWGSGSHLQPEMPLSEDMVEAAVRRGADTALFVIGRTAGENDDVSPIPGDYGLSSVEEEQISLICRYFDRVILVINSGNLIDLSISERAEIGAVLLLSMPGMEGGRALAGVLSGRVNPSGRLTDTVARCYSDYPSSSAFGRRGGLIQNYSEDIFVGYRYFESFPQAKEKVLYPFGFGLSYTSFEMVCTEFSSESGTIEARIAVTNTGAVFSGKETVMLYSENADDRLPGPKLALRAFAKTKALSPGETEVLRLSFPAWDLSAFDDTGVSGHRDAWVLPSGKYRILFGNHVRNLRLAGVYENKESLFRSCTHLPTMLEERLCLSGGTERLDFVPPDLTKGYPVLPLGETKIPGDAFTSEKDGFSVKLSVSARGAYRLRLLFSGTVACGKGGRICLLNGVRLENVREDGTVPDVILEAGTSVLTVKEDGICPIESLVIEKQDDAISIGAGISVVEGGRFSEAALYVVAKPFSDDGPCGSGQALARMHTPGRYALYHLHVEKAGLYDVSLRYDNWYPAMDIRDAFSFLISNVGQEIEAVTLKNTTKREDGAHLYATSAPIQLALPRGDCYFKIVSTTKTAPNIAYFLFTPSERPKVAVQKKAADTVPEVQTEEVRVRRPLSDKTEGTDFREVMAGALSLDTFIRSLTEEELAALSCGNDNGQIGYLPEKGIPEAYWADGPIGLRLEAETTVYPSGTMLASTWNTELAFEFGRSIGCEARERMVDVWLAPGINIHRDPCCGRNFEYYSEDPLLTGKIASAVVRGVQRMHVAATVKHFAANNTEYQRLRSDSHVSARALREIYMKAFEIVIREAGPYAVMTSYNFINGEKVPESRLLCTDVLRGEFGFEGVLVTDWGNDSDHVRELAAGHDLKMSFGAPDKVAQAMADGRLSRRRVEEAVGRILTLIMKTAGSHNK